MIDEVSDLRQIRAGNVDQKKRGVDAMSFCKALIRMRDCGDQPATSAEDLERTSLGFAANQIYNRVHLGNDFLETLRLDVDCGVNAEAAHERDVRREGRRDGSNASASGQLNGISAR